MIYQGISGRVLGLVSLSLAFGLGSLVATDPLFAASKKDEVAVEHKTRDLAEFQLADYQQELLQCSALSAIHMWIGDNLGDDEGAQVRKTLDEDYWLETSKEYLALANLAAGEADLTAEVGQEIRNLAAEWRHLNEAQAAPEEWQEWYALIDRCDSWRPDPPSRSYFNNGHQSAAAGAKPVDLASGSH